MSSNVCRVCDKRIEMMCRKGTGLCGELCEKAEKKIQTDNHEAYKVEAERSFEIYSYGPSLHGLGTIEVVQPSPDVDPEIKRPSVPCLLGALAAEELEKAGELMEGDIRRMPYGKHEKWDGTTWHAVENTVPKAS